MALPWVTQVHLCTCNTLVELYKYSKKFVWFYWSGTSKCIFEWLKEKATCIHLPEWLKYIFFGVRMNFEPYWHCGMRCFCFVQAMEKNWKIYQVSKGLNIKLLFIYLFISLFNLTPSNKFLMNKNDVICFLMT